MTGGPMFPPRHRITPERVLMEGRCGSQAMVRVSPGQREMMVTCSDDVKGHDPKWHSTRFGGGDSYTVDGGEPIPVEFHFNVRWRHDR